MIQDEVLFTLQLATVVVDLHRRIGDSIAELCKVSYLEFCLLSSVRSHGGAMLLADFSRNALASENTVVVAANALSRAGLVNKGRCASDGRLIVLEENVAGARTLTRGYEGIYRNLRSSVWANHTNEDIEEIMNSFPSVAEKLGVDTVEINRSCHSVLTPAYLMIVAALLRRWAQVVVQICWTVVRRVSMPCRFGNAAFAFALLGYRRDSHARANHGFYAGGEVSSQRSGFIRRRS